MKVRISVTIDKELEKELREMWIKTLEKKKRNFSFSKFLEKLLKIGIQGIKDGWYSLDSL